MRNPFCLRSVTPGGVVASLGMADLELFAAGFKLFVAWRAFLCALREIVHPEDFSVAAPPRLQNPSPYPSLTPCREDGVNPSPTRDCKAE